MDSISKINEDLSIKIPTEILEKAGLKPGTEIIWLYDRQGQILLMEKPNSFAKTMKGLGKDMWDKIDVHEYIREERDSWD